MMDFPSACDKESGRLQRARPSFVAEKLWAICLVCVCLAPCAMVFPLSALVASSPGLPLKPEASFHFSLFFPAALSELLQYCSATYTIGERQISIFQLLPCDQHISHQHYRTLLAEMLHSPSDRFGVYLRV